MSGDLALEHVRVAGESTDSRQPAVIVLHGRGADERDLLPITERLPSELEVLSVRAPEPLGPGYTWYQLDLSRGGLHSSQPDPSDYDRSLRLLREFVEEAIDVYELDPERIGFLGFSQGAIVSLGLLAEAPTIPDWIVALHGYLPEQYAANELEPAAGQSVFIGAGLNDEVIPATRAEDAAERLRAAGINVTFRTYGVGHGTAPAEVDDVAKWVRVRLDAETGSESV